MNDRTKHNTPELERGEQLMREAEETLRAIQRGAVDAFVVEEADGHRVYTLEGSDLPYSTLVERMQQGAAMLDDGGRIVYCNPCLTKLWGVTREATIGRQLKDWVAPADHAAYEKLRADAQLRSTEGELRLQCADGTLIPASFSFSLLSRDKSTTGILITDLTAHKQQMEFVSRLQTVQDDERKRIARELHDSAGQLLAAMGMNSAIVQSQAHRLDPNGARAVLDNTILLEQVSSEIRTISYLLHPPLLDVAGLASALRWYVDGFSERSNIKVELQLPADLGRLPAEIEIAIFRIVQECLTNIHRHSGSATASIRLRQEGSNFNIEVQDRGKGIPADKRRELIEWGRGGVGFGGMRERLRQLGGTLEIQSEGNGTVVCATLKVA